MVELFPALAVTWLICALAFWIEHANWKDAPREVRYLLGGGTLCAGCSIAGALLNDVLLAILPWPIASAGLIVLLLMWLEGRDTKRAERAQRSGEIIGAARGLTQEMIDAGQSGHPRDGRQN